MRIIGRDEARNTDEKSAVKLSERFQRQLHPEVVGCSDYKNKRVMPYFHGMVSSHAGQKEMVLREGRQEDAGENSYRCPGRVR